MNHANVVWFLCADSNIHKPNNTLPYKWSHYNGLLAEHNVIRTSMLQSEHLIYSQWSLIPGFSDAELHMGPDFISVKSGQKTVSVRLARPHRARVYAHFMCIVEQQIVPYLPQYYNSVDRLLLNLTHVLLIKSKHFLINTSEYAG